MYRILIVEDDRTIAGALAAHLGIPREGVLAMNLPNEKLRASLLGEIAAASDPVKSKKVGRNDLCPCGSGKKFKKCCGR